jgi:hypothetical protein
LIQRHWAHTWSTSFQYIINTGKCETSSIQESANADSALCLIIEYVLVLIVTTMKVRVTITVLFGVFYAVVDIQCSQFKFGLQQNLKGLVVFDLSFVFNVHDTMIMNHVVSLMTALLHNTCSHVHHINLQVRTVGIHMCIESRQGSCIL